jgi:RES domain-containing protein
LGVSPSAYVDALDVLGQGDAAEIGYEDMACAWMDFLTEGKPPPSWSVYDRLTGEGVAGILVPNFAPGAEVADHNLVLWTWIEDPPHRVSVIDPSGRPPRNQLSWR